MGKGERDERRRTGGGRGARLPGVGIGGRARGGGGGGAGGRRGGRPLESGGDHGAAGGGRRGRSWGGRPPWPSTESGSTSPTPRTARSRSSAGMGGF
ncbi:MAG: hypothetical protein MZV64_10595 [Ignavibacteriales bacterium]|nr:hypothetical protein [Ignavibacteriales bacterium]